MQLPEFMDRVEKRRETASRARVEELVKASLATLGERLYRTERDELKAQLPKDMEGFLERESIREAQPIDTEGFSLEEYYQRVAARTEVGFPEVVEWSRDVMAVLEEAVSATVIEDMLSTLPDSYRGLFGREPESPASPTALSEES